MMMLTYVGSRGCWETYMVKYTLYNLPKDLVDWKVWVFGVTTTDEIIMATTCNFTSELFYVFYFNPERKTLQTVEVQGIEAFRSSYLVHAFVDFVEDTSSL